LNDLSVLRKQAQEAFDQRDMILARSTIERALHLYPRDVAINELAGYIFGQSGLYEAAAKHLEIAVTQQNARAETIFFWGLLGINLVSFPRRWNH
jgi:tetratricopeptide (TPR) repeat protein